MPIWTQNGRSNCSIWPPGHRVRWVSGRLASLDDIDGTSQPQAFSCLFTNSSMAASVASTPVGALCVPIIMSHTFSFFRIAYITLRQYDQLSSVNLSILFIDASAIVHRY